jgi:paraquat-inducible protein B
VSEELPTAQVRTAGQRRARLSLIWAIPIVTLLVAVWLAWDTLSKRGPLITIRFDTASGLIAGQSHVRSRDVDLGLVEKLALSPDLRYVIVTARMTKEAEPLLTDKAQLWVVRPRFSAGSLTGLETIVSGSYIQLEPGPEDGQPARDFVGLEDPPVLRSSVPGHSFRLTAPRVGSLNPGSPILFRDLIVGEILGWDVGAMADSVTIHAFVREPFDRYVHNGSVFWNASGASVQLGANGLQVQLESLRALIMGGVAFDTPAGATSTPIAEEDHEFVLYKDQEAANAASFGRSLRFISYFKGVVSGLSVGSPVVMHGQRIGAVTGVTLSYDPTPDEVKVAVRYEVEPDRIARLSPTVSGTGDGGVLDLMQRGLRISLESANFLTGSKQLGMEIVPGAPATTYDVQGDAYVLEPLDPGQGDVLAAAGALLARLQSIPFEQIGENLNETLAGANGTINDPKLREAIDSLGQTLRTTQTLMANLNKGADPLLQRLPRIAADLESTMKRANELIGSLNDSHGSNSELGRDTTRLLAQLSDAARSVRILADLLARHPEALIRGRVDQEVR